jgi:hypothetical protein
MIDIALGVKIRQRPANGQWPRNISDIVPALESLLVRIKNNGLYAPTCAELFDRQNGAAILHDYLDFAGTYLRDGHAKVAKKRALQLKQKL